MDAKDIHNLQEAYMEVYEEIEVKLKTPEERAKYIENAKKREERKKQPSIFDTARKRKEEGRPLQLNFSRMADEHNKKEREKRLNKNVNKESVDIYDIILSHLLDEGYAETPEAAEAIMVNMSEEWRDSIMISEGMTMKDFKKQRSRQKQKEKRAADKIAPTRRAGIHADKASPERAARHRANVDPDFEGDDEGNYPGGTTKNPKKLRKQKAMGENG